MTIPTEERGTGSNKYTFFVCNKVSLEALESPNGARVLNVALKNYFRLVMIGLDYQTLHQLKFLVPEKSEKCLLANLINLFAHIHPSLVMNLITLGKSSDISLVSV